MSTNHTIRVPVESEALLQRLDYLSSLLQHAPLQSQPDRSRYAHDGDIKTGHQRRQEYLRILSWIRDSYLSHHGPLPPTIQLVLTNLEADLQAEGILPKQGGTA
jgi:hypothetical protein